MIYDSNFYSQFYNLHIHSISYHTQRQNFICTSNAWFNHCLFFSITMYIYLIHSFIYSFVHLANIYEHLLPADNYSRHWLNVSEIIWYSSFSVRLISLITISSRFVHVVAEGKISSQCTKSVFTQLYLSSLSLSFKSMAQNASTTGDSLL